MRLKKMTAVLLWIAGLATLLTGFVTPVAYAAGGRIDGWVTCSVGNVVGVYVNKVSGGGSSGWANAWPISTPMVQYAYDGLASNSTFYLSVGCGGTPGSWQYSLTTSVYGPGSRDFVCTPGYNCIQD